MSAFTITETDDGYSTPYGFVFWGDVTDMRDWLADCEWVDYDSRDFSAVAACPLKDTTIMRGVQRHYDGGIEAFLVSCR
jgi:hypothetical protein